MLPSHGLPDGSSWFSRQIDALRTEVREGLASVAKSIAPQIEQLSAQQAALSAQVAYLGSQVLFDVRVPTGSVSQTNVASVDQTLAYSGTHDPAVTFTAPATGKVLVMVSGIITVIVDAASATGSLTIEIVDSAGAIVQAIGGAMGANAVSNVGVVIDSESSTGPSRQVSLTPGATYTARLRRRWSADPNGSTNSVYVRWDYAAIVIIKQGM